MAVMRHATLNTLIMKKSIFLFLFSLMIMSSCKKETTEPSYTGTVTVNSARKDYNGTSINEFEVGLFDLFFHDEAVQRLRASDAIQSKKFSNLSATFSGVNPGTYFVAVIGTDEGSSLHRKVLQVVVDQTTTVAMYD